MNCCHPPRLGAKLAACTIALLGSTLATSVQALPLHADAGYNIPATGSAGTTAATGSPQDSATAVDITDFFTIGDVSIGIHTFGSIGAFTQFGNRVSGDVGGTGSYDVDGTFRLTLPDADVGDLFTFNIIPGEVSANGSAAFDTGDFVSAAIDLLITKGGTPVFHSAASAMSGAGGAVSSSFSDTDIGYTCGSGAGNASCSLTGGTFTVDLTGLTGDLVYTLFSEAHGNISRTYSDCGSGIGGDGLFALAVAIGDGGGGGSCGSVARSGDPLPEPATLALAGLGLLMFGYRRSGGALLRRG